MSKLYFSKLDDERCYQLRYIIEDAKENGMTEIEVTEAKRITGQGFFYCQKFQDCGEVGQDCNKLCCSEYSPRNGKNGRCIDSGYCYEPSDKKRIIKIKL